MKAKKFVAGFTALAFAALVLGACSSDNGSSNSSDSSAASSEVASSSTAESSTAESEAKVVAGEAMQDGTYKLEEKNYSNGYRVVFEMTVKDGKITESKYDNVNEEGKSKADDTEYETSMKDKAGIGPKEYIAQFNEGLVKAMGEEDGSPANIDVVTGATHSYHTFIIYAEQLLNAAEKGDTTPIVVDNFITE